MHMADALVAPPVAITAGVVAIALIAVSSKKVADKQRNDLLPLMGVMGAFVFAAQMINFSIPGTGASGHIVGGILLASMLGPWAAFITLCSVLIIQCLVFADGGLMALGCNMINMAAMSCLVAYPLIFRPITARSLSKMRIMIASILACTIGLELGAFLVTVETEMSGITALPTLDFLKFMLPIHFVIGLCEGIATGIVINFVASYKPDMIYGSPINIEEDTDKSKSSNFKRVIIGFLIAAAVMAIGFTWIASDNPDGLEWSIFNLSGSTELAPADAPPTAILPDYSSTLSGVIGGLITIVFIWGVSSIIFRKRKVRVGNDV